MAAWFTTASLAILKSLGFKLLILYLAKLSGKKEAQKEQLEANAIRGKEFEKIAAEHRDINDLLKRLRDTSF